VFVLILVAAPACSSSDPGPDEEQTPEAAPTTGAPSNPESAALAARLRALVAGRPRNGPGCGIGVASRHGRAQVAFGLEDIAAGKPIDDDTIFDLASNSKQFTGALVMRLVAAGRLSLDDPVAKHVPRMARYPHAVKIAQLLHHVSGIPEYFDALAGREDEVVTQSEAVDLIAASKPDTPPGTEFAYTNSNYVLLAEVVESVAGKPFADVLRTELFTPAGMTSASVGEASPPTAHLASSYEKGSTEPASSRWQQYGDGAIRTTVADVLRWGDFLTGPDGQTSKLVDAMTAGAVDTGDGDRYGAGIIVSESGGRRTLSHSGSWLGFESEFLVVPNERVAVAVLCNGTGTDGEKLRDAALALVLPE